MLIILGGLAQVPEKDDHCARTCPPARRSSCAYRFYRGGDFWIQGCSAHQSTMLAIVWATQVAADNLRIARTVIADSVESYSALPRCLGRSSRTVPRYLAVEIEVTCSDTKEHQHRVGNTHIRHSQIAVPLLGKKVVSRGLPPMETASNIVIDTANRDRRAGPSRSWRGSDSQTVVKNRCPASACPSPGKRPLAENYHGRSAF